jgi:hypothetical protein
MPSLTTSDPIHVEKNPLGEFIFYPNYVVAEWNNPEIDSFDLIKMEGVAKSIYQCRPWGYISNRTHATVTNPAVIYQLLQRECAPKAIAVVAYSMRSLVGAKLEKQYCSDVPMEIFGKLALAQEWMMQQIQPVESSDDSLFADAEIEGFPAAS